MMPAEPRGRTLLPASIHPFAAMWLASRNSGRDGDPDMLAAAQTYEMHGHQARAEALRSALRQMHAAAAQLQGDDLLRRIRSSEALESETAAQSEPAVASLETPTTVAYAAGYLGITERRVIQLIDNGNGVLEAEHDGRGHPWRVNRQSLRDVRDARSTR